MMTVFAKLKCLLTLAALAATLVTVSADVAQACTCLPPTVESSYNGSDDVVRARVLFALNLGSTIRYFARVEHTYKGCLQEPEFVVLRTPSSSAACGVQLQLGQEYLVFGHAAGSYWGLTQLAINLCDGNQTFVSLTPEKLSFLDGRMVCCGESCICADGTQPVNCFVDPCEVAPACPDGTCVANYCGGCNAEFYYESGYAVCEGECQADADCPAGHWCRQAEPAGGEPGASDARECVPFVGEGDRCNGFTLPWAYERCEPELVCDTPDVIADAPGICRPPCRESADCAPGQYCASDGSCDQDGMCERDVDCNLAGNDYPHIECVGYGVCTERSRCGWECAEPRCLDLAGYDFGACDAVLGHAVIDGACTEISGCSAAPFKLFATLAECRRACAAR
jgi:hypothetical protein